MANNGNMTYITHEIPQMEAKANMIPAKQQKVSPINILAG